MTADLLLTILSCIGFMGLVAFVSWRQTLGRVDTGAGYFLAGRGLGVNRFKRAGLCILVGKGSTPQNKKRGTFGSTNR